MRLVRRQGWHTRVKERQSGRQIPDLPPNEYVTAVRPSAAAQQSKNPVAESSSPRCPRESRCRRDTAIG